MDLFVGLMAFGGAIIIVMLIVVIAIYVAQAIFLNKFNKLVYGKGTALAWIPICNVYLLGKLTFNKIIGWLLVACVFLTSTVSTTINGETTTKTLLPSNINTIISNVYSIAVFGLFIYAIVKYVNLKKKPKILPQQPADQVQNPIIQQQIQQSTAVQPAESVVQEQNVMANNNVDTVQPVEQSTQPTPEVNNVVNPIEQPTPMTQPVQETNTITTPVEQPTPVAPVDQNVQ